MNRAGSHRRKEADFHDRSISASLTRRLRALFMESLPGFFATHMDHEPVTDRSADAHIREFMCLKESRADVGIRAPIGRFMARGNQAHGASPVSLTPGSVELGRSSGRAGGFPRGS